MMDDSGMIAAHGLYASVEHFDETEDRPKGISGILAIDPDGGDWRLVAERRRIRNLRLSRDGRTLAFLEDRPDPNLWILGRQFGSVPKLVTRLIGSASFVWSSTGEEFFVNLSGPAAREAGREGAWRVDTSGSNWRRLLLESERVQDCSPDGRWLLTSSFGSPRIKMVRADETGSRDLTGPGEKCIRPRFSPDGSRIVYASPTDYGESLWVLDLGRWERRLLRPDSQVTIVACWSPDGSRLALKLVDCVYDDRGKLIVPSNDLSRMRPRIEIMDADGGGRRPLNLPPGRILLGDWR
jgi:Tol biopolymer transport system component